MIRAVEDLLAPSGYEPEPEPEVVIPQRVLDLIAELDPEAADDLLDCVEWALYQEACGYRVLDLECLRHSAKHGPRAAQRAARWLLRLLTGEHRYRLRDAFRAAGVAVVDSTRRRPQTTTRCRRRPTPIPAPPVTTISAHGPPTLARPTTRWRT